MSDRISIQGYEGSFHQAAARLYFGKEVQVLPCATFRELVKKAVNPKETTGGLMAIENSIAGSILPNYRLLQQSGLHITGEVYLQIKQQLMVNPGVTLADIREIHSHPMALQQCTAFLDQYRWKLVETEDTALSALHLKQRRSRHIAAIAGKLAAELFGLHILSSNIHSEKNNYTRFLVLKRKHDAVVPEDANKASVNFHTDHSRGSLAKVLTEIASGGINLSKLQSVPIPGSNFKYSFHADMEFDDVGRFQEIVKRITPLTKGFAIYGLYKRGILKNKTA